MDDELSLKIEEGEIGPRSDQKIRTKTLVDDFDWDKNDT